MGERQCAEDLPLRNGRLMISEGEEAFARALIDSFAAGTLLRRRVARRRSCVSRTRCLAM